MSKFLYPIFKLKIKSWIKYWLVKKTEFKGKLSEILEGFSFTLNNTLAMKFNLFEIYGNSIQGGTPSPENEVPILSAGDNGSITEKIVNRNLADKAGNGYIGSDGTISTTTVAFYMSFIPIPENETKIYYYGSNLSSSMTNVYTNRIAFYNENQEKISVIGSISTPTIYTIPNGAKYVRASWLKAVENPMLVFGGAIPYVPHQEQYYSIPVQQPMRSIGDVRDCFVEVNGNWFERHYIARNYLKDYSYYFATTTDGNSFRIDASQLLDIKKTQQTLMCNIFIGIPSSTNRTNGNIYYNSYAGIVDIICDDYDNETDFKTMTINKNGYFDCILAEPQDLPCTEEQIEALENMPSTYKDFTIIQSEDETPAHLKIQYYKEG